MEKISQETESFSYRWLATEQSSSKTEQNFPLTQDTEPSTQNFNFDVSTSTMANLSLIHADKLFSNGVIKPQYLENDSSKTENHGTTPRISSPCTDDTKVHSHNAEEFEVIVVKKWSKLIPWKIFSKCIRCLVPERGTRGRIRVDDVNRRSLEVKSSNSSETSSPMIRRQSYAWSDSDESSIHEAILYCKQSSGLCT